MKFKTTTYDQQIEEMRLDMVAREKAEALRLIEGAFTDARAVGAGELDEVDFPDAEKLWDYLLEVQGASR